MSFTNSANGQRADFKYREKLIQGVNPLKTVAPPPTALINFTIKTYKIKKNVYISKITDFIL